MKDSVKEILNSIPERIKKQSSNLAEDIMYKSTVQIVYDSVVKQIEDLLQKELDLFKEFINNEGISMLPDGTIYKAGTGKITEEEFNRLKQEYLYNE